MRILILGGGGLGTVLAGYLARAGTEVTLFVKPAQAAAFDRQAVQISGLAEFSAPVRAASDPGELGAYDYLIVCVKARDTEAALAPLRDVAAETVLSFQNGVKKDETLLRLFGAARLLGAVSMVGGTLLRPGEARHTLTTATLVGELDGRASPRGERLAERLRAAGLPAACVPDIRTRAWDKLALFLRTALVCAIARLDIASALLDPDLRPLCVRIVREVAAVAAAEGYPIGGADALVGDLAAPDEALADAYTHAGEVLRQGPPTYPSLAQDVIAGRPSELGDTAGDVLARAERLGISVPTLEACTRLVRAIERSGTLSTAGTERTYGDGPVSTTPPSRL